MKNKIFAIVLIIVLSLPIMVWADDIASETGAESKVEQSILDEEINAVTQDIEYKQPISKKSIAKKFLAAMAGVAVSSFALFFLLSIYNRFRDGYMNRSSYSDTDISLETPEDFMGAVKSFLEKTKW